MTRSGVLLIACLVIGSAAWAQPARSKIHRLEELRAPQIDAFDRERTLFILPVGMLEVHGPHLPIGTDTLGLLYEAAAAARRVSRALPEWNVVMMPPIHYGQAGANERGGRLTHPGTYAIRQTTLRSLVADVGGQVAQNGFKWIFVLNGHGSPTHNIAISEACDFVSETFRVTMLRVTGYLSDPAKATAAYGRAVEAAWIEGFASLKLRAVSGENLFVHPRFPDAVPPPVAATAERALQNEAAFAASLETWLARRRSR